MHDVWKDEPEEHDFPAALDYLTLLFEEPSARRLVKKFRNSPTIRKKAKDLIRASGLSLLARDNPHVSSDLKKIKKAAALSPVLLVRGNGLTGAPLIVADGFHRICASWYSDENLPIACRLVSCQPGGRDT